MDLLAQRPDRPRARAARARAGSRRATARAASSTCRASRSSSAGLFGIVWGLVRGNGQGWTSPEIVGSLVVGAILVAAFVAWELRAQAPMLPMRFFRNRDVRARERRRRS